MIIKLHNLFHFTHMIFLDPFFYEHILQYSKPILLLRKKFDQRSPELKNYGTRISVCFTFTGRLWHTCRISVNGINLKCDINLETELQDFHAYLSQEKFPVLRSFWIRIIAMFTSIHMREHFFPLWIVGQKADLIWQGTLYIYRDWFFSNILLKIESLSHSKRCQVFSQCTE